MPTLVVEKETKAPAEAVAVVEMVEGVEGEGTAGGMGDAEEDVEEAGNEEDSTHPL